MRKRWLKLAAVPIAFAFLAAACGSEQQEQPDTTAAGGTAAPRRRRRQRRTTTAGAGRQPVARRRRSRRHPARAAPGQVTVFGVEDSENEAGAMQDALKEFGDANGIKITYVGRRDFEQQINAQVLGGNPPDIAAFPQPGKLEAVRPGRQAAEGARRRRRGGEEGLGRQLPGVLQRGRHAVRRAVQDRPQVARVVRPERLEGRRATRSPRPSTEFKALMDKMIANGDTPLCVGIESGPATGWPFTDWVEELVLREQGIDYYNQWVAHQVPVQRPAGGRRVQRGRRTGRLLDQEGQRVRLGRVDRRHGVRRQRGAAGRGQVHDAPPGELLQRLLPRGHASSATAPARSARSTSRPTRVTRSWSAASTRARSATLPRCGR